MGRAIDLVGRIFGRLTVLRRVGVDKCGHIMFECQCSCPERTILTVTGTHLLTGHTQSCGCLQRERTSAARLKWKTDDEQVLAERFKSMKRRCYCKTERRYSDWGGRGITICDEWLNDHSKFMDWAKRNGFQKNLEIDRINNDGPYSPDNCRWITKAQQQTNKRNSLLFEIDGETHTVTDWSSISGVSFSILYRAFHEDRQKFMNLVVNSPGYQEYTKSNI